MTEMDQEDAINEGNVRLVLQEEKMPSVKFENGAKNGGNFLSSDK